MERKVRLITAILVPSLLFVLFTTSYQHYLPQKSVIEVLDHYKSLQYNSTEIPIRLSTTSSVETVFLNKVLPMMTYKVIGSDIEGDEAVVTIQISNVNLDHLLDEYKLTTVEQTLKAIDESNDEKLATMIDDYDISLIVNLIDNPQIKKEYTTHEINLKLCKINGQWVPENSDEFFKAMLGYESESLNLNHLTREVMEVVE